MKHWEQYHQFLQTGEWHVHTNYVDGQNSVQELCQRATELGIPLLVFTEHVRRTLTYDFAAFLADIERARRQFPKLVILSGCEAKVLPDGSLDVAPDIQSAVDIVSMAFHSFPTSWETYRTALQRALARPEVDVWAHPGEWPERHEMIVPEGHWEESVRWAQAHHVLLEQNVFYHVPSKKMQHWIKVLDAPTCRGSNVHNIEQLTVAT